MNTIELEKKVRQVDDLCVFVASVLEVIKIHSKIIEIEAHLTLISNAVANTIRADKKYLKITERMISTIEEFCDLLKYIRHVAEEAIEEIQRIMKAEEGESHDLLSINVNGLEFIGDIFVIEYTFKKLINELNVLSESQYFPEEKNTEIHTVALEFLNGVENKILQLKSQSNAIHREINEVKKISSKSKRYKILLAY